MLNSLSARVIAAIVPIVIVLLLAFVAYGAWQSSRTNAARARLSTNQAQAVSDSAKDAINATGAVSARQQATDDLTRSNADAIRHAKGADAPVDPVVRDAGLRSLCRRPGYSSDPKCLRFSTPGTMASPGPAGAAPGR